VNREVHARICGSPAVRLPRATRHCKDSNRPGSHEHVRFTFLGYTFRPRRARNRSGVLFANFLPAVGDEATKAIRHTIKRWRLHRWSGAALDDLAREINPIVRGWINYYGGFYPSRLVQILRHINEYLVRWAMRKYKRLRRRAGRAWSFLRVVAGRQPEALRSLGVRRTTIGRMMGAR
jgi:RNA-directed DNA polymerase